MAVFGVSGELDIAGAVGIPRVELPFGLRFGKTAAKGDVAVERAGQRGGEQVGGSKVAETGIEFEPLFFGIDGAGQRDFAVFNQGKIGGDNVDQTVLVDGKVGGQFLHRNAAVVDGGGFAVDQADVAVKRDIAAAGARQHRCLEGEIGCGQAGHKGFGVDVAAFEFDVADHVAQVVGKRLDAGIGMQRDVFTDDVGVQNGIFERAGEQQVVVDGDAFEFAFGIERAL